MDLNANDGRLQQTETDWVLLQLAHAALPSESRRHWTELLCRYERPVTRFLRHLVRDEHIVEEIHQEFWVRMLRGDFAAARPERGRFRYMLKTVLVNMVADYFRKRKRERSNPGWDWPDNGSDPAVELTARYLAGWRVELLERVMEELAKEEQSDGHPWRAILNLEIEHPKQTSAIKAEMLARLLNRPMTAENYRKILSRARKRFMTLLILEVRATLVDPTEAGILEELAELELLEYCKPS